MRAECGKDAGELDRDVTRSQDGHALWHARQIECIVGNDPEFRTWYRQSHWISAGADHDVFGGDALAANVERMWINEGCMGFEDGRARIVEQSLVDTVEPTDLLVLRGDQLSPVMRPLLNLPAEAGCVLGPRTIFTG